MNTRNILFASNKVLDIEKTFQSQLSNIYSSGEIRQFLNLLFESFLGWELKDLLLNRQCTIDQSTLLKFHWALVDLKQERPIQYIIGSTDFCNCKIAVNSSVLIPRPETEEIVFRTISQLNIQAPKILDICTGSGCIAISLAKHIPGSSVSAIDISSEALKIAGKNAANNGVQIDFQEIDILKYSEKLPNQQFDLIISNPPYIRNSEATQMCSNVLDYEPHLALFVEDQDPLVFYRIISEYALRHLSDEGILVFEINENLGFETNQMLNNLGFKTTIYRDFRDKERSIVAKRKPLISSLFVSI